MRAKSTQGCQPGRVESEQQSMMRLGRTITTIQFRSRTWIVGPERPLWFITLVRNHGKLTQRTSGTARRGQPAWSSAIISKCDEGRREAALPPGTNMSATDLALLPRVTRERNVVDTANGDPKVRAVIDFVTTLVKFIPADVLTLYISALTWIRAGYAPMPNPKDQPPPPPPLPPDWAVHEARSWFIFCIVATPVWILGLRFIAARSAGIPYIIPWWAAIAGTAGFYAYSFSVDNIWRTPPNAPPAVLTHALIFVAAASLVLTFLNMIVGAIWKDQQVQP